jgi:hypothetical protein
MGSRLLLGSGRFISPAPQARFAWPEDMSQTSPAELQSFTVTGRDSAMPSTLVTFDDLPDDEWP